MNTSKTLIIAQFYKSNNKLFSIYKLISIYFFKDFIEHYFNF